MAAAAMTAVGVGAQTAPAAPSLPAPEATVEADPIRCWWRTSAGAVRIGETFTLDLTCAVLDTEAVRVEPDESRLGGNVIQMAPFEVVDSTHPPDIFSGQRRFFQYQYVLRIINPDVIGMDVDIPNLAIRYRVSSRMPGNAFMQGRDLVYLLPQQTVKVLSTVPAGAPDIRDSTGQSFTAVDSLVFRARLLEIVAITLVVLGALMAIAMLIRLLRQAGGKVRTGEREWTPRAVLVAARRELGAVQRESDGGWNEALVGRAAAATRVASAVALDRPVSQHAPADGESPGDGRLRVDRVGRASRVLSSSVTAEDLNRRMARQSTSGDASHQALGLLQTALTAFGRAQYSREAALDRAALDAATASAIEGTDLVRRRHGLLKTWWRRWSARAARAEHRSA
jgi:hypothetical protein